MICSSLVATHQIISFISNNIDSKLDIKRQLRREGLLRDERKQPDLLPRRILRRQKIDWMKRISLGLLQSTSDGIVPSTTYGEVLFSDELPFVSTRRKVINESDQLRKPPFFDLKENLKGNDGDVPRWSDHLLNIAKSSSIFLKSFGEKKRRSIHWTTNFFVHCSCRSVSSFIFLGDFSRSVSSLSTQMSRLGLNRCRKEDIKRFPTERNNSNAGETRWTLCSSEDRNSLHWHKRTIEPLTLNEQQIYAGLSRAE